MNLLLMANSGPLGFPNRPDALWVPGLDTQGRNILPVGSEDFVSGGWHGYATATYTVTDYPTTINGVSVVAKRIQSTGGTYIGKIDSPAIVHVTGVAYKYNIKAKVLSGNAKIKYANAVLSTAVDSDWADYPNDFTGDGFSRTVFSLYTNNIADTLDILVYQPQINLVSLYPYSAPVGLPQSLLDRSGHGISAQNGSTAGEDTNDPSWTGNGLRFDGVDDYCTVANPLVGLTSYTLIVAMKVTSGISTEGHIFEATNCQLYHSGSSLLGKTKSINIVLPINTGQTYVVALRSQGTQSQVMANDVFSSVNAENSNALGANLYLGRYWGAATGTNHNGEIYLACAYKRALSDAEYLKTYRAIRRIMLKMGVTI